MYYKLNIWSGDNRAYITSLNITTAEQEQLVDGNEISLSNNLKAELKNKTKELPDVLGDSISKIVISAKLRSIFDALPQQDPFQYFPVMIHKKEYFLTNILHVLPCFDWDKSTYTTYSNPKVIRDIEHLVLKPDVIDGYHIFRMAEEPYAVYISETLKEILIQEKVTGIKISDINMETYEDYKL